jgi:hypothetical protein
MNARLRHLQTVHPRKLAAVRREVAPGAVGSIDIVHGAKGLTALE